MKEKLIASSLNPIRPSRPPVFSGRFAAHTEIKLGPVIGINHLSQQPEGRHFFVHFSRSDAAARQKEEAANSNVESQSVPFR